MAQKAQAAAKQKAALKRAAAEVNAHKKLARPAKKLQRKRPPKQR